MKKVGAIAAGAAVFVLVGLAVMFHMVARPTAAQRPVVEIGGVSVHVALATTTETRERGLGGKKDLANDEGMLFVFSNDGIYPFWMKDMLFSIDIIWISSSGRIVYIQPELSPSTYPNSYGPSVPARYVLEVQAGFSALHGVMVGQQVGLQI